MTIGSPSIQSWLKRVEALQRAPDWPQGDSPIEVIHTHISVVLLGRRYVLKLKKPVDFGFLDYTTLDKRRAACEAELRLNRRLCPEIYLDVTAIKDVRGQPRFTGDGTVVDYGVVMKRLPGDRMLDRMIASDSVSESIIDRVAGRLSNFYNAAERGPRIDLYGSPGVIRQNCKENFDQTSPYVDRTINSSWFDAIASWTFDWLEKNDELLRTRVREGRICDGHGDVRCESICITNGICIYDCIEFNDRFRCGDSASEVAFLAMDLHARGRPDLGYYLCEQFYKQTSDRQLFALLPFYRCYRAFVRGKVLSFRLDEKEFSQAERNVAKVRAGNYFDLARRYADRLREPTVIAVAGLSGTGKTAVARAVAGDLGLRLVSSDDVRRAIFGEASGPAEYGEGAYTSEANRITYQTMLEKGRELLEEDRGVVLDATFRCASDRRAARAMTAAAGATFRLIECTLSPEIVRSRLDRRSARGDGVSDATWETYRRQREEFDAIERSSEGTHLVLDTSVTITVSSHRATDWLRENQREQ